MWFSYGYMVGFYWEACYWWGSENYEESWLGLMVVEVEGGREAVN